MNELLYGWIGRQRARLGTIIPVQWVRQRIWLWLLTILFVASGGLAYRPAGAVERKPLNAALLATVRVIVPVADEQDVYSTGSGTVLSEDGYILTNYHVMGDIEKEELYNARGFAGIAVNPPTLKGQPVLKFTAVMVRGNPALDLAVLRIVGLLEDAEAPLPDNLGLSPIKMGNSDDLLIGDEVSAIGFPTIGGDTVTFTTGIVSGFLDEDRDGVFEWIKADVNINHGNSGGLAINEAGEMIGVPTAGNTDLGTIGLIRDGNLAFDFYRKAVAGFDPPVQTSEAYVTNVRFARAVDAQGNPLKPAVRFASGTDAIYAIFDYGNFSTGQIFEFTWYHNGFEVFSDNVVWRFGQEGTNWVNVFDEDGLDDGYYEVAVSLDGDQLYRDGVVVGESSQNPDASFGAITFAEGVTDDDQPLNPGTNFSGIDEVYAFFDVYNVANGTTWTRRWYLDGDLAAEKQAVWNAGSIPSTWIRLTAQDGLPVGHYRLELSIEDKVVQNDEMDVVAPEIAQTTIDPVLVVGTIVQADNRRRPIVGATVFFLQDGVTTDEFLADPKDSLVYASGVSNEEGVYQLDNKLTPGAAYSVVVYHEQFKLVAVDDYQIDPDAVSPHEIDVTMEGR